MNESLFCSDGNQNQIWVLGIIDNITKLYRLDISYQRNASILKTFITKYVERGNTRVWNGRQGYSFIYNMDGYNRNVHIHVEEILVLALTPPRILSQFGAN